MLPMGIRAVNKEKMHPRYSAIGHDLAHYSPLNLVEAETVKDSERSDFALKLNSFFRLIETISREESFGPDL